MQKKVDCRQFLLSSPIFKALPEAALSELIGMSTVRSLTHHQQLFGRGDAPEGMFAVTRGWIRPSSTTAQGREALLASLHAGEWFGESAVFDGHPRGFSNFAHGANELLMIPMGRFNALLEQQSGMYRHFVPWLCQRIRLSTLLLESNALLNLKGQMGHCVLLHTHMQATEASGRPCTLSLSQEDVGLMLGRRRQSINKLLSAW